MQREAVEVTIKDFLDYREGGISLQEFFGGIYLATGGVMFVVGLEGAVNLVEEVALRGDFFLW